MLDPEKPHSIPSSPISVCSDEAAEALPNEAAEALPVPNDSAPVCANDLADDLANAETWPVLNDSAPIFANAGAETLPTLVVEESDAETLPN